MVTRKKRLDISVQKEKPSSIGDSSYAARPGRCRSGTAHARVSRSSVDARCALQRVAMGAAFAVALTTAVPDASAEYRTTAHFLRQLRPRGTHPLADASGLLPLFVRLAPGEDARARGLLPLGSGFATVRLAPERAAAFVQDHPDLTVSVWPQLRPLLDRSLSLNRTDAYRNALAEQGSATQVTGTGKGVVVGVLDTGIDITHADFLDTNGATRVAWLLDMTSSPLGLHPDLEAEFGCTSPDQSPCAILSASDIDKAIAGRGYRPVDLLGHGTHVASIAAGNGGKERKYLGTAPEATLIVAAVAQPTGDLADPDIVTGARFVFDRAENMEGGPRPAVVNLSLGGDFGPHNGTTPLEQSLAGMVGPDYPGRAIVVAAGNSGAVDSGQSSTQALGIHTEAHVTAGSPASIPVLSPGKAGDPDLHGAVYIWLTHRPGDRISIGLTGPGNVRIAPIRTGATKQYDDDKLTAFVEYGVNDDTWDTGLLDSMDGAVLAWMGDWAAESRFTIELEGEGTVQMWLYGIDDAGITDSSNGALFETATWEQTVNVPATHPRLLAVGCTMNRLDWTDAAGEELGITTTEYGTVDGACYFSSAGPSAMGVAKPEISAPGGFVVAAMSRDSSPAARQAASLFAAPEGVCPSSEACFLADDTHAILSGSSMSSPQVAGAVALLLERDPSLHQEQILRLVQQGARRPKGDVPFDYQIGAGALDIVGMMAAYDALQTPVDHAVDATASWVSLSSSYMRPDPTWPLTGTIELRTSSDTLADLDDAGRLQLTVAGPATIQQPPTRVAAGLYSFELRADANSGLRDVTVDVKFDGKALGIPLTRLSGHRVLPIATDRWSAHGVLSTTGGCSVHAGGQANEPLGASASGASFAFGALCLRTARRRARKASRCRSASSCERVR